MPVKTNGTDIEKNFPFFLRNMDTCQAFDRFIIENNGETRGTYNAWSYLVVGKIRHENNWQFGIKKATYTSGNLLLSSKYQNLHYAQQFKADILESPREDFLIRKKKYFDFIRIALNPKLSWFDKGQHYIIKRGKDYNQFQETLCSLLSTLFSSKEVFSISYKNSKLIIDLRCDKVPYDLMKLFISQKL